MPDDLMQELWKARRSSPDDLRAAGLTVAVHNDYQINGTPYTFWLMTGKHGEHTIALKGEGASDEEALDLIRAEWAKLTDHLHHAPFCPANHYHGKRAPTYGCTCGVARAARSGGEEAGGG
jgi:hypothetical protein